MFLPETSLTTNLENLSPRGRGRVRIEMAKKQDREEGGPGGGLSRIEK